MIRYRFYFFLDNQISSLYLICELSGICDCRCSIRSYFNLSLKVSFICFFSNFFLNCLFFFLLLLSLVDFQPVSFLGIAGVTWSAIGFAFPTVMEASLLAPCHLILQRLLITLPSALESCNVSKVILIIFSSFRQPYTTVYPFRVKVTVAAPGRSVVPVIFLSPCFCIHYNRHFSFTYL